MRLAPLVLSVRESGRTARLRPELLSLLRSALRRRAGAFPLPGRERRLLMRALPSRASSRTGYDRRGSRADLASGDDASGSQCAGAWRAQTAGARRRAHTGRRVRSVWLPEQVPNGALEAIRALEARSFEAETRLGASSPRVLGAALMRMKPKVYRGSRPVARRPAASVPRAVLCRRRGHLSAADRRSRRGLTRSEPSNICGGVGC